MTAEHHEPMAELFFEGLAKRQHVDDRPLWIAAMRGLSPTNRPDAGRRQAQISVAGDRFIEAVGATTVLRGPVIDPRTADAVGRLSITKFERAADLLAMTRDESFGPFFSKWLEHAGQHLLVDITPMALPPIASPVAQPAPGDIVDVNLWRFGHPDDVETFLEATMGIAASVGAGYDAWFEVRSHIIGSDTWDELVVSRYPDLNAHRELLAHPVWREATERLAGNAAAHTRAVVAPLVNTLATSVDVESASLFDA